LCMVQITLDDSLVSSQGVQAMNAALADAIRPSREAALPESVRRAELPVEPLHQAMEILAAGFYPEVLDMVASKIAFLASEEDLPASEIVVLAPYLSDALRFSLAERLSGIGIAVWSHRPSRSLREEPVTLCLLTLAMLAYPEWGFAPTRFDVAYALMQAIEGLDLVRSRLLVDKLYRVKDGIPGLTSFDQIDGETQQRITYRLGERFEGLREWLADHRDSGEAFDHFMSRLFGEMLSQPSYGFHADFQAGQTAANLIESIRKFRWVAGDSLEEEGIPVGKEFLRMVQDGVIAAQYFGAWQNQPQDAVLLAPAYTFLMSNRPVRVQFWLDAGSSGWSERLEQPLTHPYVLSRHWEAGRKWTDFDELEAGRLTLEHLVTGLLRRCREKVYLGISDLGEQGYEQRGPLLQAVQRVRRILFPQDRVGS
jgi:hypothetical protein